MSRLAIVDTEITSLVRGALLAGMSCIDCARTYNISKSSVSRIKARMEAEELINADKVTQNLDELLIASLNKHLNALNTIAEVATEKDYLRNQKANDLALLHEQINNHIVRLFQSFSAPAEEEE